MLKIGVMVDSFRLDLKEGIKQAKAVGADGIQIYAVSGEMDPAHLSIQARRDLLHYIQDTGLVVSALCGDLGSPGFADREQNRSRIEKSKRIVELAHDLETPVVTTHIGVVPAERGAEQYQVLAEACHALGEFAAGAGVTFAIETGPEKAQTLKAFLDDLATPGIGVNLDPANLVMVVGDDPVQAVHTLQKYIVHTHAKDGIQKKPVDPELVYHPPTTGSLHVNLDDYFAEVPLGQGQVNFPTYLAALREVGFDGFLTIEREVGEDPRKDIAEAVQFLRALL